MFYSIVHFVLQIGENTQLDVVYRKSDRLRVEACETNGVSQPLTGNICGTPFNIATVFSFTCCILTKEKNCYIRLFFFTI